MKFALLGATGNVGSRILGELHNRGHKVVAVARDTSKVAAAPGVTTQQNDLSDANALAEILGGADAVVSAYAPPPGDTAQLISVTGRVVEAVRKADVPRLIVVGGAASLQVAPGVTLYDSGHLPDVWKGIALSHIKTLALLKASEIDWTYFSPAAFFEPGTRSGKFRLGKDELIVDAQGQSRISMEDYAVALVDELEKPEHQRERFTIGY
jgi:putative NADH-flavin reductase